MAYRFRYSCTQDIYKITLLLIFSSYFTLLCIIRYYLASPHRFNLGNTSSLCVLLALYQESFKAQISSLALYFKFEILKHIVVHDI